RALPLLGGAAHLLHPAAPRHLAALARLYGPALRLRLGGADVVVLSSVESIREAFTRRWGACAGRPPSYLAGLVSRGGQDLALGDVSPGWRRQRRATRDALARAQRRLDAVLAQQAQALCEDLRRYRGAPVDVAEDFAFRTCSTICSLVFGPLMPAEAEVRDFTRCIMGLLEVWGRASVRVLDLLPPLRALPNPALRELLRLVEHRDAFVQAQLQRHEAAGCPPGGMLGDLWPDPGVRGGPLGPDRLHMALVDLFIGGTETTAAALAWAVAFLLHRPEVPPRTRHAHASSMLCTCQGHACVRSPACPGSPSPSVAFLLHRCKAHAKHMHPSCHAHACPCSTRVSRVPFPVPRRPAAPLQMRCTRVTLPCALHLRDTGVAAGVRAEVPGATRGLLGASVCETLRLRPPAPLALPHRARAPTSIAGALVPRDSLLVPNLFAAHHDPDKWQRPEAFLPERFLEAGPGRALVPFGCGARACLGEGLARAELLVFLGHILRHFRLEPPAPGVLPSLEVTAGTVLRCPPFRVRLIALEH
ncbi:steroid 21-hydroxylase-like, partial [Dromaius novaehollandiae]|uniref:steroid 21-hydroxylase-like n=1 Tax=Dromaius novaehollandiae TaxID=8790 RepID=UPI00311D784D